MPVFVFVDFNCFCFSIFLNHFHNIIIICAHSKHFTTLIAQRRHFVNMPSGLIKLFFAASAIAISGADARLQIATKMVSTTRSGTAQTADSRTALRNRAQNERMRRNFHFPWGWESRAVAKPQRPKREAPSHVAIWLPPGETFTTTVPEMTIHKNLFEISDFHTIFIKIFFFDSKIFKLLN